MTKFSRRLLKNQLQTLHYISDGKLINIPHKGLDSCYVVDTQSVEDTCCKDIEF